MSIIQSRPNLTIDQATLLFQQTYGRQVARIDHLDGERDQNFRVETTQAEGYVFKICNVTEPRELLLAQHEAMTRLSDQRYVPQLLETREGETLGEFGSGPTRTATRAVRYIPGSPLATLKRPSDQLLADLGRKLAELDLGLSGFDAPILHRAFPWNLLHGLDVVTDRVQRIAQPHIQHDVQQCVDRVTRRMEPYDAQLRRAVIHNDVNDYNIIVSPHRDEHGERLVNGLIDFGDIAYSYLIGELAITLAYIVCRRTDWLDAACQVIRGYHRVYPLEEVEVACLLDLMLLRLSTSVCMSEQQQAERPDDPYLSISQKPIRDTLPKLLAVHPQFVECRFRDACDWTPHPSTQRVTRYLARRQRTFAPVMGELLKAECTAISELGLTSHPLQSEADGRSVGGYNEARLLYTDDRFASDDPSALAPRRTIHLGVDITAQAGTPVFAPIDGIVVVSEFRAQAQDYGGLVIIRHTTDEDDPYFTLFGHLSRASLARHPLGSHVTAGEEVGRLGSSEENGGWFPHLHFQLIIDLLDLAGEFPGVAFPGERAVWTSLSPNPSLLIGMDEPLLNRCDSCEPNNTLENRRQRISGAQRLAYRKPLEIVRGEMQYLYDHTGRRFLDAYNNVPHVGHCHPRVVAATAHQLAILNTNTRYLHPLLGEYATRLSGTLPAALEICFFVNSASEANELALRLSRAATGRTGVIVQTSSYHGNSTTLIDVSPYKHDGPGGMGPPPWVHTLPLPDRYRGRFRGDEETSGREYAAHAAQIVESVTNGPFPPAAFLAETCPSVGGQIMPPSHYLPDVYDAVRTAGALTIADEVQTGFGRLGSHFWAFQRYGVVPDIVVMGKPMGNGHPIAAVVTTREIANRFDNGMEFFSTFGGNTVSCAAGLAVLDVLADEQLQARAANTGRQLQAGLEDLQARFPIVGDVRGAGLFWGVELVRNRESLEPADREATLIINRLRARGILIGTDGPRHNVLKIRPPMQFQASDAATLLSALGDVLDEEFN